MGSPISPIVDNSIMEEFEIKAIKTGKNPQGYGSGILMTHLSIKRQNTAISSYNISIPLTLI